MMSIQTFMGQMPFQSYADFREQAGSDKATHVVGVVLGDSIKFPGDAYKMLNSKPSIAEQVDELSVNQGIQAISYGDQVYLFLGTESQQDADIIADALCKAFPAQIKSALVKIPSAEAPEMQPEYI